VVKSVNSICKGILIAAVALASISLWAESKGALELQHPTAVAGKTLATGNYVVRWEGKGDQVELKIYQGKNVVASLPARVIQLSSRAEYNSAVVNQSSSGNPSLAEIRFGGKKYALQISNEGSGSGSTGAAR
jgi:hypothetical protein